MKKVVLHRAADAELNKAVAYYKSIDLALADRFYREMERLIREVSASPTMFRLFDPPARRHFSLHFPYGIIYLDQSDRLWIVAVMHLNQQPTYWKPRLK